MDTHQECGGSLDFNKLARQKVQFICNPYPAHLNKRDTDPLFKLGLSIKNTIQFLESNPEKHNINFHQMDKQLHLRHTRRMQTRMNTGIGAILDVLNYDI